MKNKLKDKNPNKKGGDLNKKKKDNLMHHNKQILGILQHLHFNQDPIWIEEFYLFIFCNISTRLIIPPFSLSYCRFRAKEHLGPVVSGIENRGMAQKHRKCM